MPHIYGVILGCFFTLIDDRQSQRFSPWMLKMPLVPEPFDCAAPIPRTASSKDSSLSLETVQSDLLCLAGPIVMEIAASLLLHIV